MFTLLVALALGTGGLPFAAAAQADTGGTVASSAPPGLPKKVEICHATESDTNPYVLESPNRSGDLNGHVGHQDGRDIIPPFDYYEDGVLKHFDGQNWPEKKDVFDNGCVVPTPTPTPEPTPEPTPDWFDLSIDKTVAVEEGVAEAGEIITYQLTIRHEGTVPAPTVTVTDALPATLSFVEGSLATPEGWMAEVADGVLTATATSPFDGEATISFRA